MRKKIKLLFVIFVKAEAHEHINQKINLINWISTIQEEDILSKLENIQKEASDWWDAISKEDKTAITDAISQLEKGDYLSRSKVRSNIKERIDF